MFKYVETCPITITCRNAELIEANEIKVIQSLTSRQEAN